MTQRLPGRRRPHNLPQYPEKPALPQVTTCPDYFCDGCGRRVNALVEVRVWRGLLPTNIKRCTSCKERRNQR